MLSASLSSAFKDRKLIEETNKLAILSAFTIQLISEAPDIDNSSAGGI